MLRIAQLVGVYGSSAELGGDANWKSSHTGSMQFDTFEVYTHPNGEIEAHYHDTSLRIPCSQGSVPLIGVDAHTVKDIQAGVKFAASHNL